MYWIKNFVRKKNQLRNYISLGRLVERGGEDEPDLIVNKDGSLMSTVRYRGPDLDSGTMAELGVITQRLNHGLLSFGTGWVIQPEAQRLKSSAYERDVYFPDDTTKKIDEERKEYFSTGSHYESSYFFTLYWMPPPDTAGKLKEMMIEGREKKTVHFDEHISYFVEKAKEIFGLLQEILPELVLLKGENYLTYLHSVVSSKRHKVAIPRTPQLLDSFLYDTPLSGGLEPMLGKYHIRVVVPLKYVPMSEFGMFNALNRLNFEYRWVTRYFCQDKADAISETGTFLRLWKSKMKSAMGYIKEIAMNTESSQINENALLKAEEAGEAKRSVEADEVSYGFYSTMIVILDKNRDVADKKAKDVEQTLKNMGFFASTETLNAVDAWMGSIPGNVYNYVRRPLISTGNLVHMLPLSDVWAGPERNYHLNGPTLIYTQTDGYTPFRLNFHIRDVGHTFLVGPTGAGKSVHLCLIMAQFRKYKNAKVFAFDKGGSMLALTAGVGGNFFDLGNEGKNALSFQPLAQIDDEGEKRWVDSWLQDYLRAENVEITPEVKQILWKAIDLLCGPPEKPSPIAHRNISGLMGCMESSELGHKIRAALLPLASGGAYGNMFDAKEDTFSNSSWQVFEMERLWNMKSIMGPTLMYLFHKIEQRLDGSPVLIVLDECWALLEDPIFAAKIKMWLKELRKKNAFVVFATQSLSDVSKSTIVDAILDSCPTKIFLPNANAVQKDVKEVYKMFGLNEKEIELISIGTPKRHYYYKSELGSRMYELALGKEALMYCAAGSKEDQKMVRHFLSGYPREEFNRRWREYKLLVGF